MQLSYFRVINVISSEPVIKQKYKEPLLTNSLFVEIDGIIVL